MIDLAKTMNREYGRGGGYLPQMTTGPATKQPYGPDPEATTPPATAPSGEQDWNYDPYQDFQMDAPQPFPFPDQWANASNYFTNLMGSGVQSPWQYGHGSGQLQNLIGADGQPVDIQGYAESQLPVMQTLMGDLSRQAMEEATMTGTRQSTVLQQKLVEQARRLSENYGADIANKWMQAQEAAMGRKMGGLGLMLPYGQAEANLGLQNTQNQMYGASALQGIGSDYLYAPMNIAQGFGNLGNQIYGQQAQGIDQFQNDPWLQTALGLSQQPGSQQYPQTYQPSWTSQILGLGANVIPQMLNSPSAPEQMAPPAPFTF